MRGKGDSVHVLAVIYNHKVTTWKTNGLKLSNYNDSMQKYKFSLSVLPDLLFLHFVLPVTLFSLMWPSGKALGW